MRKGLTCLPCIHILKFLPSSKAQLSSPLCQEAMRDSSKQLAFAEPTLYANPYVTCLHIPFKPRESSLLPWEPLWCPRNLDSNLDPATAFGKSLNFSLILDPANWVERGCERVPSTQQTLYQPAPKPRGELRAWTNDTFPGLPQRRSWRRARSRGGA